MKISKISISNYSRLADCEIEVGKHLLLVGPNDAGKSSLMRCLNFALGLPGAQLYSQVSVADFRSIDQPFAVEITLSELTTADGAIFPDELITDPATSNISLIISLEVTVDQSGETIQIHRTCAKGRSGRSISREQLAAIGWKFLTTQQSSLRDIREDRDASLQDILSSVDLGVEQETFDALNEALQNQLTVSTVLDNLRESLANQLSKALPHELGKDELAFVSAAASTQNPFSDVHLQVTRGGTTKGLSEQSDGARALFALAIYDLVSAAAHIVAIDEPEVHLHPASQRSLARLLFGGGNQKILATHSSDIVGAAEPEWIVSVREAGVLRQPQSKFLFQEERLMARWWVKDKLEPLTARHLVVVEGAADRIFLSKAAELLGVDFDRLGVSVLEMGGSELKYILKLFGANGFDIPMSVLIDRDAAEETAKSFNVTISQLRDLGVFVCDKDLEAEYIRAAGASDVYQWIDQSKLFSTGEFANFSKTGPSGTPTESDALAFCGADRRKIKSVIAIASRIGKDAIQRIAPISDLINRVKIS